MAEKGYGGQFVGGANGCEMVDVDQKADAKELDASGGRVEAGAWSKAGLAGVLSWWRKHSGEMYVTLNGLSRMLSLASDAWVWAVTWLPGTMEARQSESSAKSK